MLGTTCTSPALEKGSLLMPLSPACVWLTSKSYGWLASRTDPESPDLSPPPLLPQLSVPRPATMLVLILLLGLGPALVCSVHSGRGICSKPM
jgi:hypothetical protein